MEFKIKLPRMFPKQREYVLEKYKRKIIRGGRRSGKTEGAAILAVINFLRGKRILYAAPTAEQLGRFWRRVSLALSEPIQNGIFYKNETEHIIELKNTENRIKAKTAWNADTLRGDYADLLILDEWQLMDENAWETVGAPMLLDNDGDAVFIYTPPSYHTRSASKARDPMHAAKLFERARNDTSGRWMAYHLTSHDNPYISQEALDEITKDMSYVSYRLEILAEDIFESPGALWKRDLIEKNRVHAAPHCVRIVVGIDPSATSTGDEAGIITAGRDITGHYYVLSDDSLQASPLTWAQTAITAYRKYKADRIVAEANQGGEMVKTVIAQVDPTIPVSLVYASRGKQVRAEPIVAQYEKGLVHHAGIFPKLEDELCFWVPGNTSPNRLDALVWAITEILQVGHFSFDYRSAGKRISASMTGYLNG